VSGYSDREFDDIRQRWKIRFPPDLMDIYRKRRSVIDSGFDWIRTPRAEIQNMFDWPLEGMLFDVKNNAFWLDEWGEKPKSRAAAEEIVRVAVTAAPRLIPVNGHRYIPETPYARGNPVFSVYQTDIIVYGADLADYVAHETHAKRASSPAKRKIPFWTHLVELNGG
jgi:hypothetical protein